MLTPEQKKERLLGIGGSDASVVVGESQYMTPLELYLIKIGELNKTEEFNEAAHWGNVLEPIVAQECAARMGFEVEKPKQAIVHPKYYWIRCNLDFVVKGKPIVGECKTTGYFDNEKWGKEETEEIPTDYLYQCIHNAIASEAVYKTEQVIIPVLAGGKGGHKYRMYRYERNKELEEAYIHASGRFWKEHVEKRIPPLPTRIEDTALMWPCDNGDTKIATPEIVEIINYMREIKASQKQLDDEEKKLKMEICKYMGNSSALSDEEGSKLATWKGEKRRKIDKDLFEQEFPNLYNQFLITTSNRVFRTTK